MKKMLSGRFSALVPGVFFGLRMAALVALAAGCVVSAWHFVRPFTVVETELVSPVPFDLVLQTDSGEDGQAVRPVHCPVPAGESRLALLVPARQIADFEFEFLEGSRTPTNGGSVVQVRHFSTLNGGWRCDFGRLAICLAVALGLVFAVLSWKRRDELFLSLSPVEWLFLFVCLTGYALWAVTPNNYGPDEAIRFSVTQFLFEHGRLPVGTECLMPVWGFSYAHRPTLLVHVLGAAFMRLAAGCGGTGADLLLAARLVSVLCGVGAVYWVMRTSRLLFRDSAVRMLMVCLVAFLPQFAFLSGYVNNDVMAVFGTSMIVYSWVFAARRCWTLPAVAILAVGLSVCLMSYQNSYGWVLLSAFYLPLSYVQRNGRAGLVRTLLFAVSVTTVLSGYLFIRHLVLYGDLFGMATQRHFAELYARPDFVPGVKETVQNAGEGLWKTFVAREWFSSTAKSFVGYFGPMVHPLPDWCYRVYLGLVCTLGAGVLLGWCVRPGRPTLLASMLAIGCLITGALCVHYSYAIDWQPQGRYCMPMLVALVTLLTPGAEWLLGWLPGGRVRRIFVVFVLLSLAAVHVCAYGVMLKSIGVV